MNKYYEMQDSYLRNRRELLNELERLERNPVENKDRIKQVYSQLEDLSKQYFSHPMNSINIPPDFIDDYFNDNL